MNAWSSGQGVVMGVVLVDVVVIAVVLLAALRGWRRGGVRVAMRAVGAAVGIAAGSWAGAWLATRIDLPVAVLVIGCLVLGGLLGSAVGARIGKAARRQLASPMDRRPVLPDRLLGVGAYAVVAVVCCALGAALLSWVGPDPVSDAVARSATLRAVPTPWAMLDQLPTAPLATEVLR